MLARRAETDRAVFFEEMSAFFQSSEMPLVNVVAFALEIRAVISAALRTFVPIEPEPAESIVDRLRRRGRVAGLVGVLDPQHQSPAGVMRVKPVEERRPRAADVKITGGRRGETNTDSGTHRPSPFAKADRLANRKPPGSGDWLFLLKKDSPGPAPRVAPARQVRLGERRVGLNHTSNPLHHLEPNLRDLLGPEPTQDGAALQGNRLTAQPPDVEKRG